MPIYSDNEAELEDRFASFLAGAGATSSLAASAAATLRDDPSASLTPRLRAAVASMVEVVERATEIDLSQLDDVGGGVSYPEELVAKLAQPSMDGSGAEAGAEAGAQAVEWLKTLLADLRSLLDAPSSDAASRAETFLGSLSMAESAHAQSLARGSLELELTLHSPLSV